MMEKSLYDFIVTAYAVIQISYDEYRETENERISDSLLVVITTIVSIESLLLLLQRIVNLKLCPF